MNIRQLILVVAVMVPGLLSHGAEVAAPNLALRDAERRIAEFKKVMETGTPLQQRQAAWKLRENPATIRVLNRQGPPELYKAAAENIAAIQAPAKKQMKQSLEHLLKKKVKSMGGELLSVDIVEFTNPRPGIHLGQDLDITPRLRYRINGREVTVDLKHMSSRRFISEKALETVVNRSIFESVHHDPTKSFKFHTGQRPIPGYTVEAAEMTAAGGWVDIGHSAAAESFVDPDVWLGTSKGGTVSDPRQIAHTLEYKSFEPQSKADELLGKAENRARELANEGKLKEAKQVMREARGRAAGIRNESLEQALKAFDRQILPHLEVRGYPPPKEIEEGMKIMREYLNNPTGSISELNSRLRKVGLKNWSDLVQRSSSLVPDLMQIEKIKMKNLEYRLNQIRRQARLAEEAAATKGLLKRFGKLTGEALMVEFLAMEGLRGYTEELEERAKWNIEDDAGAYLGGGTRALHHLAVMPAELLEAVTEGLGEQVYEEHRKAMKEGKGYWEAFGTVLYELDKKAVEKLAELSVYAEQHPGDAMSNVAGTLLGADALANYLESDPERTRQQYEVLRSGLEGIRETLKTYWPMLQDAQISIRDIVKKHENVPENVAEVSELHQAYRDAWIRVDRALQMAHTFAVRYPKDYEAEGAKAISEVIGENFKDYPPSLMDIIQPWLGECRLVIAVRDSETKKKIERFPVQITVSRRGFERKVEGRDQTEYTLRRIPAGAYRVDVWASSYTPRTKNLEIFGDQNREMRGTIYLARERAETGPYYAEVTVIARDYNSDALIPDVEFTLHSPEGSLSFFSEAGTVRYDKVAAGTSRVTARAHGYTSNSIDMEINPDIQTSYQVPVYLTRTSTPVTKKREPKVVENQPIRTQQKQKPVVKPAPVVKKKRKPPAPPPDDYNAIGARLTQLYAEFLRRHPPGTKVTFQRPYRWDEKTQVFTCKGTVQPPNGSKSGFSGYMNLETAKKTIKRGSWE